ncbi:hypothetical protein [Novosphingobium capsulatum]|uniref:hypothetical protein n=1 Tax=Novosphingobium capsulatum TaxID=13688 RepID=UPI00142F3B6A|nr:hypothetical protein [Novosphingobium capsulatum]WQD93952.1 hypothetical protein U0041_05005 [Novosphingobium capsulatum]
MLLGRASRISPRHVVVTLGGADTFHNATVARKLPSGTLTLASQQSQSLYRSKATAIGTVEVTPSRLVTRIRKAGVFSQLQNHVGHQTLAAG